MDLVEEGLTTDLVFRSARPEVLDETDDCWDCELVARALDDRRGEGGAMSKSGHRGGERKREGDVRREEDEDEDETQGPVGEYWRV